jgi:CRP/FNR family cyclic AMP-dependent transcriptional regulator
MDSPANRLSADLVALLAERGDVRRVARGELLIREGEFSESLFILLSGKLRVFTQDERGREVIYNSLDAGEVFGEMFLDGGPRSASVKALSEADCIEVRGSEIREFMRAYPHFSETLVVKLIERLRHATLQIRSLALDGVFARTVTAIAELATGPPGERYLSASVTQQEIANRIGATREMVNHVFRDLHKAGVLVRDEHGGWLIAKVLPRH